MSLGAVARACLLGAMVGVVTGASSSVEAGQQEGDGRPPFVRVYSGIGVTRSSDLHIQQLTLDTQLTFEEVSWEHRSLTTNWTRDSIPYMGLRAGFFLPHVSWLGVSFEAVHFKILAETDREVRVTGAVGQVPIDVVTPMKQFVEIYQVTNGVNLFLANVEVHRGVVRGERFPRGRLNLYGGGGAGAAMPYTSSVIAGERVAGYGFGRLATQVLGGLSWHLSPRWDVSLEYKHTATTVDGAVARGESESRLHTNHAVFGLGFHFGP